LYSFLNVWEREVVVVDPVPLPAYFINNINTITRAITTPLWEVAL